MQGPKPLVFRPARGDIAGVGTPSAAIRTPDQRLRVFVSSTLKELADERKAVRSSVERIGLAPVMFELGARPHPPRQLYRAYLEQSDIFVGLYWERYGWVAPDEAVSGLEDEYNLAAPSMPKLIYIKETSGVREPRLADLLDRIRNDDGASFKYFTDAAELGDLLVTDLAILLAEQFDRQASARARGEGRSPARQSPRTSGAVPAPVTALFGREREVAEVQALLAEEAVRLVTIVGPGGIGKTRLAMEVAANVGGAFPDGVFFVPLGPVEQSHVVASVIAQTLGIRDEGDAPLPDKIALALRHRRRLLVLDNFEQVMEAAPLLADLLTAAPGVKLLVTSRTLLRLTAEHSFEVGPLGLPILGGEASSGGPSASVRMFVDRARAVKPDFELTPENAAAVERICLTVEGVPLAVELAAAKVRLLTPAALLDRMSRQLSVLVGGQRDLPARQQTLRNTIEWSVQLLGEGAKRLLKTLSVFAGRFSLEAAEFVSDGFGAGDSLEVLGDLVDSSLVHQHDHYGKPYFSMLVTVREYGLERLEASGELDDARNRHAAYYARLAEQAQPEMINKLSRTSLDGLRQEQGNLRAALRQFLDRGDPDAAAEFAWNLMVFWVMAGLIGEIGGAMGELLRDGSGHRDRTRAIALYFTGVVPSWQRSDQEGSDSLAESAEMFRRDGDRLGEAIATASLALALMKDPLNLARAEQIGLRGLLLLREAGYVTGEAVGLTFLGNAALLRNDIAVAQERFSAALALHQSLDHELGMGMVHHYRGWAFLLSGSLQSAEADFSEAMQIWLRIGDIGGMAFTLEGFAGLAAARDDAESAGRLLGAAEATWEKVGIIPGKFLSPIQILVGRIEASGDRERFERARATGREMRTSAAVEFALSTITASTEPQAVAGSAVSSGRSRSLGIKQPRGTA